MSEPRTEIARRIYGVAGGRSERKTDSPNQTANQVRTQRARSCGRNGMRENRANDKDQHESADNFAEQVGSEAANRWCSAKARQFCTGLLSFFPMWAIMQPHECGAEDCSQNLRRQIAGEP